MCVCERAQGQVQDLPGDSKCLRDNLTTGPVSPGGCRWVGDPCTLLWGLSPLPETCRRGPRAQAPRLTWRGRLLAVHAVAVNVTFPPGVEAGQRLPVLVHAPAEAPFPALGGAALRESTERTLRAGQAPRAKGPQGVYRGGHSCPACGGGGSPGRWGRGGSVPFGSQELAPITLQTHLRPERVTTSHLPGAPASERPPSRTDGLSARLC